MEIYRAFALAALSTNKSTGGGGGKRDELPPTHEIPKNMMDRLKPFINMQWAHLRSGD